MQPTRPPAAPQPVAPSRQPANPRPGPVPIDAAVLPLVGGGALPKHTW